MRDPEVTFVIPTYRLRDVGETVEQYDEHFWRNGHAVRMIVFDDSSPANQEKYYPLLEQTHTHNELLLRRPAGEGAVPRLSEPRLRDKRLEGLVKNLFRPSYGGNRNFTLMYTLGGLMVSSDDDMRPYALMEHSPESLDDGRGQPRPAAQGRARTATAASRSTSSPRFWMCSASRSAEVPDNYERGELLSTPPWTWRPTPPRDWRGRTRCSSSRRPVPDRRRREDGPDVPLRHQRHRRPRLRRHVSRRRRARPSLGRAERASTCWSTSAPP